MNRQMRRIRQLLSKEETEKIMKKGTSGVLALLGDDDYPYAVPLSYVYCDSKIYFHSAKAGHKIDAIKKYEKASFCVIDEDKIVSEEYTTYFRSAIAFGKIQIIEDEKEKHLAIETLASKYSPKDKEGIQKEINKEFNILCMLRLDIENMTGKQAIELVNKEK